MYKAWRIYIYIYVYPFKSHTPKCEAVRVSSFPADANGDGVDGW